MKEISLCFMTRELCHRFFCEHENDPAVYEDESEYQPYVYSREMANSYYERKQVAGRVELVAKMGEQIIGHETVIKSL